jgi:hypothetical protein
MDYIAAGALGLGTLAGCGKADPPAAQQSVDRVVEVTKANFEEHVLKPHLSVLRIYHFDYPGSSASIGPYRKYARDFHGRVTFGTTDGEEDFGKSLAKQHGIKNYPAFLFHMDGKHQGTLQGWPGEDDWLMRMMETFHHECCKPPQ